MNCSNNVKLSSKIPFYWYKIFLVLGFLISSFSIVYLVMMYKRLKGIYIAFFFMHLIGTFFLLKNIYIFNQFRFFIWGIFNTFWVL